MHPASRFTRAVPLALVGALLLPTIVAGQDDPAATAPEELVVTPAQAEGPFYPVEIPLDPIRHDRLIRGT